MLTLKFRNVKTILVTQFENFPIKYCLLGSQDPGPLLNNVIKMLRDLIKVETF